MAAPVVIPAAVWRVAGTVLAGFVFSIMSNLVGRVLIALGVGYAVYSGLDLTIGWLMDYIQAEVTGLGSRAVQVAYLLRLDVVLEVVAAAYLARLSIVGFIGGVYTRFFLNRPVASE